VPPPANALPVGPDAPHPEVVAAGAVSEAPMERKREPVQTTSAAASDVPWWLSETPRNAEPARPPVIWQPAKVSKSRQRSEDGSAAAAAQNDNPDLPQQRETAKQSWERASAQAVDSRAATVEEEATPTRTSRLGGLRNLLFVLGVKNAHGEEQGEQHASGGSNSDQEPVRQNYERTILEARGIAERSIGSASPRLVTAPPEFLPPKPVVIEFDKGDARVGESSTRQDRRANADGVEVLPSKHGQYKKV